MAKSPEALARWRRAAQQPRWGAQGSPEEEGYLVNTAQHVTANRDAGAGELTLSHGSRILALQPTLAGRSRSPGGAVSTANKPWPH